MLPFQEYDERNPAIWREFEKEALLLIRLGAKHLGSKAIFEQLRRLAFLDTTGEFKVNNNYTADYARKFMAEYTEYEGFFKLRGRK